MDNYLVSYHMDPAYDSKLTNDSENYIKNSCIREGDVGNFI